VRDRKPGRGLIRMDHRTRKEPQCQYLNSFLRNVVCNARQRDADGIRPQPTRPAPDSTGVNIVGRGETKRTGQYDVKAGVDEPAPA
jgi:hypothetical protein